MLISTLIPAIIIVAVVQILVRKFRSQFLSYGLPIAIAAALMASRTVHLVFTGIEVAGIGCLITWFDPFRYWAGRPSP